MKRGGRVCSGWLLVVVVLGALWGPSAGAREARRDRDDTWEEAIRVLEGGVESRVYPGAAAVVGTRSEKGYGGIVFEHYVGRMTYGKVPPYSHTNEEIGSHTLFDLASLTKVVGTTSVVAWLYEKGLLSLDTLVSSPDLLGPEFAQGGKGNITVEDCMLHQAGFPPDPSPCYWDPKFGCDGAPLPLEQSFACTHRIFDSLMTQTVDAPPGTRYVYSDLSMITMMFVAGKVIHDNHLVEGDNLMRECMEMDGIYPVKLQCEFEGFLRTVILPQVERASGQAMSFPAYRPPVNARSHTAPTVIPAAEGLNVTLQGRVEDGNAEMLGGISGHAGTFATASDLAALMHTLLFPGINMSGLPSPYVFLNKTTIETFTTERDNAISSRALGWNTNDPTVHDEGWNLSCGNFSSKTFMHLGYTGTMVCGDPINGVYLVLLTNRVYPTDQGSGIHAIRQNFSNAVVKALNMRPN
ncbi:beta-lactamase [Chloropicon primus]|uniref:Beta-lactamase n=1 Tax=Chloropicon primus TaxID=1764295 RepID=A0A5B8MLB4_9CHLO|nr:beta-lactamase [Chloropicon primus]UPR00293.1 beta-lactamase [Chloropicon primus]|eukprot:QDZ21081.1 beta-lactamase [Chloropicon primus]